MDQNRRCRKKDKDHIEFLCELYEEQVARGRCFVHEPRMRCMAKVMAAPGKRTTVADLCMFGLAGCDEGGPGFVNVVGLLLQSKGRSTRRDAQVNADFTFEKGETNRIIGSPSCSSNGGTVERGPAGAGDARTSEEGGRCEEDTQDCS